MERLPPLDASFLRMETPTAHMHVGWLAMLDLGERGGALEVEGLRERIAGRLHHAPRFRQRVLAAPVGEPLLTDDPGFRLEDHVVTAEVDRDGVSEPALREVTDRFLSEPLDRSRPLWQFRVIPRVGRDRAAVLGKVHHALVDGVAAVELGMLLFDLAPDPAPPEPMDWAPPQPVSPARIALGSVADTALEQFKAAGRVAAMGLRPRRTMRVADSMRRAAFSLAEQVGRPAPTSYLNRPIRSQRTLLTRSIPLARLERLKRRLGVRLNDVVLAVAAGALRRHAAVCEEELVPLRAMVPVNARREDGEGGPEGNRIVFGFVELPITERDPMARVELIRVQTEALKDPDRVSGSDALLASIGRLPAPLQARAARAAGAARTFNLTISNVPGPRTSLYVAGSRVQSIYPVIPLSDGHALAIGVLSYGGGLHFALHADPTSLDEAAELPGLVESAISELEAAAGGRPPPRPGRVAHSRDRALDLG